MSHNNKNVLFKYINFNGKFSEQSNNFINVFLNSINILRNILLFLLDLHIIYDIINIDYEKL
jgi:hypothetical protein